MEQFLIGLFAGADGFDLLFWFVIGSGLIFSLMKGSEK